jgi:hypothetical protein
MQNQMYFVLKLSAINYRLGGGAYKGDKMACITPEKQATSSS